MKQQKFIEVSIDGILVARKVAYCDDMESRHIGLLGRNALTRDDGVMMTMPWPRSLSLGIFTSIHMVGMKFPIATAWLSKEGRVVHTAYAKPGGLFYGTWSPASYVMELHPDHLNALKKGALVTWAVLS